MREVDFLPDSYRHAQHRRLQLTRSGYAALVLIAFIGLHFAVPRGLAHARAAYSTAPTVSTATDATASAPFHQSSANTTPPDPRNLSYINREQLPRAKASPASRPAAKVGAGEPNVNGIPDAQAKWPAVRAEDIDEPDGDGPVAERLAKRAARLHLQSVLMGPAPRAMIDGQLLQEGDVVANFRVLKIEPRGITLEREGIRLEVLFKNDLSR